MGGISPLNPLGGVPLMHVLVLSYRPALTSQNLNMKKSEGGRSDPKKPLLTPADHMTGLHRARLN